MAGGNKSGDGKLGPLSVVQGVDLGRYMGRWYEIANIPSPFQPRKGQNTRATYSLQPDGKTVDVLNETWSDGKRSFIKGTAWQADPASPDAKLLVRFWVPPFLPVFPVTGDYWVMLLDKEGYQWAVVGQPSRKNLWILSRTPTMSEELYKSLIEHAEKEGYDVSKLVKTVHTEDSGDDMAEDDKGVWWVKSIFGK